MTSKTKDPKLENFKKAQQEKAIARLPEFKTLNLTDDPKQIKTLIKEIDAQAGKEIAAVAQEITLIETQQYYLVGRCFIHLKSITEKGGYKEAIDELGYTYDEVKHQVKMTETYINQALTRKKDNVVLLGPGMLGTMSRNLSPAQLKALGSGKKVFGLRDKDLENMSSREFINRIKLEKAKADEAVISEFKKTQQLCKSHDKIRTQGDTIDELNDSLRILTDGPKDVQDIGKLAQEIIAGTTKIDVAARQLYKMNHAPEANAILTTSMSFATASMRKLLDQFENIESDQNTLDNANIEATLKRINEMSADNNTE